MSGEASLDIGSPPARDLVRQGLPPRSAQERPEPAVLAAWLEGALDEAAAEPVERWIATDPRAAAEIALLRTPLSVSAPAPVAFVTRAQAIVPASRRTARPAKAWRARGGPLPALFGQPLLRWGAVAVLALGIGLGGFQMGNQGLAPTLQPDRDQSADAQLDFGASPSPFL